MSVHIQHIWPHQASWSVNGSANDISALVCLCLCGPSNCSSPSFKTLHSSLNMLHWISGVMDLNQLQVATGHTLPRGNFLLELFEVALKIHSKRGSIFLWEPGTSFSACLPSLSLASSLLLLPLLQPHWLEPVSRLPMSSEDHMLSRNVPGRWCQIAETNRPSDCYPTGLLGVKEPLLEYAHCMCSQPNKYPLNIFFSLILN